MRDRAISITKLPLLRLLKYCYKCLNIQRLRIPHDDGAIDRVSLESKYDQSSRGGNQLPHHKPLAKETEYLSVKGAQIRPSPTATASSCLPVLQTPHESD